MAHSLSNLAALKSNLESAMQSAHQRRNELAEALAAIRAEKDTLKSAPLSRADLESVLTRDIESHLADVLSEGSELAAELKYAQSRAVAAQLDGNAANLSPFRAMQYSQSGVFDRMLLLAEPKEILKRLKPLIDRLDFSQAGPPLADRQKRLSELSVQESALLAEQTEINRLLGIAPQPAPKPASDAPVHVPVHVPGLTAKPAAPAAAASATRAAPAVGYHTMLETGVEAVPMPPAGKKPAGKNQPAGLTNRMLGHAA